MVAASVRIELCGQLVVERNGERLERSLPGRQGRLLFSYLVLNRDRPVGRHELVEAVWPFGAPADATAALRALVSKLRRALGPDLVQGRDQLRLCVPDDTFVDLEHARATIRRSEMALAAGELRSTLDLAGGVLATAERGFLLGYETPWAEEVRLEIAELGLRAFEVVAQAGIGLGGPELASAERAAKALIERAPFRENGYRCLMEAHAAQGNVAEALLVYELLRRLLREEIGAGPGAAIKSLHERLLITGEADHAKVRAAPPPRPTPGLRPRAPGPTPLPAPLAVLQERDLAGRQEELRLLLEELHRVEDGRPRLVLLSGEQGIGKTRLCAEFAEAARTRLAGVLYGRSDEETLLPCQPFVEAVRHYIDHAPADEVERAVKRGGPHLLLLFPDLRGVVSRGTVSQGEREGESSTYRLFAALSSLLAEASRAKPLLLVLDDLHWADHAALQLVEHLLRSSEPPSLLIVGNYRPVELARSAALRDALTELRRDRLFEHIPLEGLDEKEVLALISQVGSGTPPPDFARHLTALTAGNPSFVGELVSNLADRGLLEAGKERWPTPDQVDQVGVPQGVRDLLDREIGRLPEEFARVLSSAATAGDEFTLDLAERLWQGPPAQVLEAVELGIALGFLVALPGRLNRCAFRVPLVRKAFLERLSGSRRVRLERRTRDLTGNDVV